MTAISAIIRLLSKFVIVLLVVFGTGFTLGCQKQAPPPRSTQGVDIAPRPTYLEHTVKYSGETLGIIAKWYTGNANNWRTIAAANPGLRPDRMRLGQLILIPQELVTQSTPLPARNVRGLAAETKAVTKQIGDTAQKEAGSTEQPTAVEPTPAARTIDEDLKELEALDESAKGKTDAAVVPDAPNAGIAAPSSAEVTPAVNSTEANPTAAVVSETTPPAPAEVVKDDPKAALPEAGSGAQADDAERERLLDELLQQQ